MSEVPQRKASRTNARGQSRAVAAAASANADSDSSTVSFQSPRKRSMKASAVGRKKARATDKPSSTTVDATAHRYPLRSRSTRSTVAKPANQNMTEPLERSNVSSSWPTLPQAVTPASAAPRPRQLQFEDNESSAVPSLFAEGRPTCRCPRLCNFQTLTGFEYLKHYGEDVLQYLDEKESTEHRRLPLSCHSSTHQQGSRHDSSTLSSPSSSKPGRKDDEKEIGCAPSPSSSDSGSTVSGPVTPRPDSVIGTKARIRNGDKNMRFLEEPAEKLERQPHINQRMRAVLVSWLIEVSIEYNCSMAAYHLAISLLDKVLDCGPTSGERISWLSYDSDSDDEEPDWPEKWFVVSRSEFQALGCACLWMASKMEDRDPPLMEDFFYISDQSVSTYALRNMESRVCKILEFRLQCLTPIQYFPTFLRAGRHCQDAACTYQSSVQHHMVMYLVTLGRLSYAVSRFGPSVLIAAAVYLSRVTLDITEESDEDEDSEYGKYWSATLAQYTGFSKDDLKNPVFLLYHYQLKAEELNVAVFHHFTKTKFDSVSIRTAPRLEDLGFESPIRYDLLDVES